MTNSKYYTHGSSHNKIHFVLSGISLIFLLLFIVQWNQIEVIIVSSSLPNCDCVRSIEKRRSYDGTSICDNFATLRGNGQNVVAYSFYGNSSNPRVSSHYLNQITQRAKEIENYYPDWTMRIYYHIENKDDVTEDILCQNWCQNKHLDLCDVTQLPIIGDLRNIQPIGRTWRFATLMDNTVNVFISRDLDSEILPREVAAVSDWLKTNKTFHIMRDHPSHNGYIMAGLWGVQYAKDDRQTLRHLAEVMLNSTPRHYWDFDQALLRRIIWPEAVKNSLQHDSYSCNFNKFNTYDHTVPFPTQRQENLYVGWGKVKSPQNQTGIKPCPKKCRLHSDWTFC